MPWASALAMLGAEGWSLNEDAATLQLAEALPDPAKAPPQAILAAALKLDLKKVGTPCLPDNINRSDSIKLQGTLVLQLVDATDITQPTKFNEIYADRPGRMLRLKLTDGSRTAVGVEYYPIPGLKSEALCPGVKLKVSQAVVRCGTLLLDPNSVQLLGGRVENLAETWEVQQRYGGTAEREAEGKGGAPGGAAAEHPPPFKPFDPTAPRELKKVEKKAQEAALPSTAGGRRTTGSATAPFQGPSGLSRAAAAVVEPPRNVANAPLGGSSAPSGAKAKLLERLSKHEEGGGGRRGRGRGPRRGRRCFDDADGEDDGKMTLEEWEAKKKAGMNGGGSSQQQKRQQQLMSDEELARRLQAELDLEEVQLREMNAHAVGMEGDSSSNYFYGHVEADDRRGRGGRGRGCAGAAGAERAQGRSGGAVGRGGRDGGGGREERGRGERGRGWVSRGSGGDGSSSGGRGREGSGRRGSASGRGGGGGGGGGSLSSFRGGGGRGGRQSRPQHP